MFFIQEVEKEDIHSHKRSHTHRHTLYTYILIHMPVQVYKASIRIVLSYGSERDYRMKALIWS